MASLNITNEEVYANLALVLGIDRDSTNWDTQTTSDVERIIRQGRRKLFSASDWQFLEQAVTIKTIAPVTTGTITIVAGVVTFTSAVVPTDVVNYVLVPEDSDGESLGVYQFSTFTDTTHATLKDTSVAAAALTTYSLYKFQYALASNFGGWLDPVTRENNQFLQEFATLPEWVLRGIGNRNVVQSGEPDLFAVSQTLDEDTGVPSYYLRLHPLPDAIYVLNSRIRIQPGDALDEIANAVVFPAMFAEIMQESILSAAEIMYNDVRGVHTENYERLLPDFVRKDRMMRGTRQTRPRDFRTLPPNYQAAIAPITYE